MTAPQIRRRYTVRLPEYKEGVPDMLRQIMDERLSGGVREYLEVIGAQNVERHPGNRTVTGIYASEDDRSQLIMLNLINQIRATPEVSAEVVE